MGGREIKRPEDRRRRWTGRRQNGPSWHARRSDADANKSHHPRYLTSPHRGRTSHSPPVSSSSASPHLSQQIVEPPRAHRNHLPKPAAPATYPHHAGG